MITSAGLVSALVLTGCSYGSEAEPRPQLPQAIARTLPPNILQIETDDIHGNMRPASAVRVAIGNKTLILTAAHMLNGGTKNCADENITQPSVGNIVYSPTRQTKVQKSSDDAWKDMRWQDAAVIETDGTVPGGSPIELSTQKPEKGTQLLMANYQNTSTGEPRDTSEGPALFDATVIGTYKDKIVIASGDGKSYGKSQDTIVRPGSSGGAAIVEDHNSPDYGKLAGLSVVEWLGEYSNASIASQFGYDSLQEGSYKVSFLEPTTEAVGRTLAAAMVSCDAL
jgi:hypothetical protein